MKCKICNKFFNNSNGLSKHLRSIHDLSLLEYHIEYEEFKIPKCECGKNKLLRTGIKFGTTCGNKECLSIFNKNKKHNEKTKKIISESMKKYLKNNPDKHVWKRNSKFLSKPCEEFKKILTNNDIKFISEFSPLNDRLYSIDICIPNKKIGIEINGNQHYNNDKTLKKYYKERKYNIENNGWILYDIHYSKVYDVKFLDKFINHIKNNFDLSENDFDFVSIEPNKCIDCKIEISKNSKRCRKCSSVYNGKKRRKVKRPSIKKLKEEIMKYGYRGVGKKYGVSDNAIRKWSCSSTG